MSIERLKRTRIDLGLSVREAQGVCWVSHESIRRIEAGLTTPRLETLDRLVAGYKNYALAQAERFTIQARKLA